MSKKYKLKKWYPSLHPQMTVGYEVSVIGPCGYYNPLFSFPSVRIDEVENNPEFWEEVRDPEFQILAAKTSVKVSLTTENTSTEIYKILRLSDNAVFSVGDKIKMIGHANDKTPEQITKIELNKEGIPCLFTNTFHNNGINIFKAIKCEKLLTSEDGIDMYQNDTFWHVDSYFGIGKGYLKSNEFNPLVSYKHFSTEKAAKDWIDLNKPKYSKRQIMDAALVKYVTGTILLHIKDIK